MATASDVFTMSALSSAVVEAYVWLSCESADVISVAPTYSKSDELPPGAPPASPWPPSGGCPSGPPLPPSGGALGIPESLDALAETALAPATLAVEVTLAPEQPVIATTASREAMTIDRTLFLIMSNSFTPRLGRRRSLLRPPGFHGKYGVPEDRARNVSLRVACRMRKRRLRTKRTTVGDLSLQDQRFLKKDRPSFVPLSCHRNLKKT